MSSSIDSSTNVEPKQEHDTVVGEKPETTSVDTPTTATDDTEKTPFDDAKGPPPAISGPVSEPANPSTATVEQDTPAPRIIPPARRESTIKPPAETNTLKPLPSATPPRTKYTIKRGDRLIDIAEYEYDNGDLWKAIKAVNPSLDENRLFVGATIELPSREEAERLVKAAAKPAATPAAKNPSAPKTATTKTSANAATYVVGHGDTLIKIARNVLGDEERWREIYDLNRSKLDSPDVIQLGMELKLPPKSKPAADNARG